MRDLRRQLDDIPEGGLRDRIIAKLALVSQLLHQQPKGSDKIYALHEPEVDCISKGKARVRYEFGCKVSIATTVDEGFVVGMRSFAGNPYDGHTLRPALEQVEVLTDQRPDLAVVDRGYRGHGENRTRVLISGTRRGLKECGTQHVCNHILPLNTVPCHGRDVCARCNKRSDTLILTIDDSIDQRSITIRVLVLNIDTLCNHTLHLCEVAIAHGIQEWRDIRCILSLLIRLIVRLIRVRVSNGCCDQTLLLTGLRTAARAVAGAIGLLQPLHEAAHVELVTAAHNRAAGVLRNLIAADGTVASDLWSVTHFSMASMSLLRS
jgi:hypothetical protein